MAEELRLVLTIIGVLAIGGILGHGLWSVRKNRDELRDYKTPSRNEPELGGRSGDGSGAGATDERDLDHHGVGRPRVIAADPVKKEPVIDKRTFSEVSQPVEPVTEAPRPQTTESSQTAQSPSIAGIQAVQHEAVPDTADTSEAAEAENIEPSEVLILHLGMADNQTISGASLLPLLISMGFKFGEMEIFHRHENSSGTGAILFSLANMYNPGSFDIDNMEQTRIRGLSLFMTLPSYGDALQNFNMMHNAAKKIAEEFNGQILDSHRSVMTIQTVRHYVEKIREFERKQLIKP